MRHAQIRIDSAAHGLTGEVLLDGEPIRGVTGVEFTHRKVTDVPVLTLHFAAFPVEIDAGVLLHISDETRKTLIQFGWLPPVEDGE